MAALKTTFVVIPRADQPAIVQRVLSTSDCFLFGPAAAVAPQLSQYPQQRRSKGCVMNASCKSAYSKPTQPEPLTFYEVNEYGTITDPRVREPKVRSDVFSNGLPAQIHSTDHLIDEVDRCSPLAAHAICTDAANKGFSS